MIEGGDDETTWAPPSPEALAQVAGAPAEELAHHALSIVGPRNRVDEIVGELALTP